MIVKNRVYSVVPANLSLGGILVEFAEDEPLEMLSGTKVQIKLTFENESLITHGVVRHRQGQRYGVCFDSPSSSLARVVIKLQRRWLARRIAN